MIGYHDNASNYMCVFDGIGIKLKISVVDLSTGEVGPVKPMRGEVGWTVEGLKLYIGEVRGRILSFILFSFFISILSLSPLNWSLSLYRYLVSIHLV